MARLRIPGGQLKTYQLREIARIATELTTGYIQITHAGQSANPARSSRKTLLKSCAHPAGGLHTRGSGADNIRNLTSNRHGWD